MCACFVQIAPMFLQSRRVADSAPCAAVALCCHGCVLSPRRVDLGLRPSHRLAGRIGCLWLGGKGTDAPSVCHLRSHAPTHIRPRPAAALRRLRAALVAPNRFEHSMRVDDEVACMGVIQPKTYRNGIPWRWVAQANSDCGPSSSALSRPMTRRRPGAAAWGAAEGQQPLLHAPPQLPLPPRGVPSPLEFPSARGARTRARRLCK